MDLSNEKQNRSPLFSVIISAYNSQEFLEKGVNSVLSQTYEDFELVLVNDGSNDNTPEICNEFAKNDVRVKVFHQENSGHTSARNTGLKNSCGQYVLFLDSDDWLDTNALEVFHKEILKTNPDAIVYDICQQMNDNCNVLHNVVKDGFYHLEKDKYIFENLIMSERGDFSFWKSLNGKVFKREKVSKYQLKIPKDVLVGEDGACFVLTIFDCDTVSVISDVFYHYSVREGSVSHSCDKNAFSRYLSLMQFYQDNLNLSDNQLLAQLQRYAVAHLYTALQFVIRSDCSRKYLISEYKKVIDNDFIKNALKNAKFNKEGRKMKIKQLILRKKWFFLVKPLNVLTHM